MYLTFQCLTRFDNKELCFYLTLGKPLLFANCMENNGERGQFETLKAQSWPEIEHFKKKIKSSTSSLKIVVQQSTHKERELTHCAFAHNPSMWPVKDMVLLNVTLSVKSLWDNKHQNLISTINFTMISILTRSYSVNIKDKKVRFSQNVLYHMKDDFM